MGSGKVLSKFPKLYQENWFSCGPACFRNVLKYNNIIANEKTLTKKLKTDIYGTRHEEIVRVAKSYSFNVECQENMTIGDLKDYIDKNIPVIINIQYEKFDDNDHGHYVIVNGYNEHVIFIHDPDPESDDKDRIEIKELLKRWHDQRDNKIYNNLGIAIYKGCKI